MADVNPVWKVYNEPNSIKLPESVEVSGDLNNGNFFAIDIGRSLTKIAYYSTTEHKYCYRRKNVKKCPITMSNNLVDSNGESSALSINNKGNSTECGNNVACEDEESSSSQKCSRISCEVDDMSRLHFIKFQTKYIESCLDFIENHIIGNKELVKGNTIKVTGSGVCKYGGCIKEKLGVL